MGKKRHPQRKTQNHDPLYASENEESSFVKDVFFRRSSRVMDGRKKANSAGQKNDRLYRIGEG